MYILHLKLFFMKKWGKGRVFQEVEMYFYIEMRDIVFFWNAVNSRYLKVEVHPKQLIFQFFWSHIIYFEISQFAIHETEINILTVTNGYNGIKITVRIQTYLEIKEISKLHEL